MRELCQLRQEGTVAEYKKKFDQLVYHVRLYDPTVKGMMLVTQFVLGLKEGLRGAVESQLPNSVTEAATYALVHERISDRAKKLPGNKPVLKLYNSAPLKQDVKQKSLPNELWKAQ